MVEEAVSDEQMANAIIVSQHKPLKTKKSSIIAPFLKNISLRSCCLKRTLSPSVACGTPIALEWDEAFKNMNDPSGRAVAKVHDDAYDD